jgi:hypothetical protein
LFTQIHNESTHQWKKMDLLTDGNGSRLSVLIRCSKKKRSSCFSTNSNTDLAEKKRAASPRSHENRRKSIRIPVKPRSHHWFVKCIWTQNLP